MSNDDGLPARPYARGRGREAELLRAAASAFAHNGYQKTSMAVIAAEAGMTQAGILYHHSSKAHLYRTVVKRRIAPEELARMEGADRLDDMVERIVAYVRWIAPQQELLRFRAVFSGEALVEENPATDILLAEHRGSLRILIQRIRGAQLSGEIRADADPQRAALELMALNEGYRHLTVAHGELFDYAEMFEEAIRRWYSDLRAADAPGAPKSDTAPPATPKTESETYSRERVSMGLTLTEDEQSEYLRRGHTGILTTLRRDGSPVSLPVWYVWHDDHVFVASPPRTAKVARVKHDDRAWFLVESGERWLDLSAVGFPARVVILDPGPEADELHAPLAEKYREYEAPFDRLPDVAKAHYADRLIFRLERSGDAISWDNSRMRLR